MESMEYYNSSYSHGSIEYIRVELSTYAYGWSTAIGGESDRWATGLLWSNAM